MMKLRNKFWKCLFKNCYWLTIHNIWGFNGSENWDCDLLYDSL